MTATQHRLAVDGAELAYEVTGSGAPLLYAHGIVLSRATEDRLDFTDWRIAARQHTYVRYDARGHGLSTGRPLVSDYTWDRLASDMLSLLDGFECPADCIGSSMGCGTLLTAAARAPHRFRRLVLVLPPNAWETRKGGAERLNIAADIAERDGKDTFVEIMAQMPKLPLLAEIEAYPPPPDVTAELLPFVLRGAAASDLPDPGSVVEAVTHPTLILTWDGDPAHPLATASSLAKLLPNAELH